MPWPENYDLTWDERGRAVGAAPRDHHADALTCPHCGKRLKSFRARRMHIRDTHQKRQAGEAPK